MYKRDRIEWQMAKLDLLTLRVSNPDEQKRFYCNVLGMRDQGRGCVGYSETQVALKFAPAETPYISQASDLYWKIAISVPNIELACTQLLSAGVGCSEPHQFEDVGYLAHFTDPEGFSIELIDHEFKNERRVTQFDLDLLGGGPHLSLVTLRTADIKAVESTLLGWGMQKLSIQPIPAYGFTLHFYAFTDDIPPDDTLTAVANRTWVYQRTYTVLELQHVDTLERETVPTSHAGGFGSLKCASTTSFPPLPRLKINWTPACDS